MRSSMLIAGGAIVAAAVTTGLLFMPVFHGQVPQPAAATASVASQPGAATPAASSTSPAALPATNALKAAPGEPGIFAGFAHWTTNHRAAAIGAVMGRPDLDLDVVAFLGRELDDRTLDATSRNNAANALIAQRRHDAGLAARLLAMADDPRESSAWRDYALQHAARAQAFSDHAAEILARLIVIAGHREVPITTAPGAAPAPVAGSTLRGTALLQLDQLDRDRHPAGLAAAVDADIAAILADPQPIPVERFTAIGLVGTRGLRAQAPQLRALLGAAADPSTLRACLAAMGSVGGRTDAALLRPFLAHRHPLVALAARAALARLNAQDSSGG